MCHETRLVPIPDLLADLRERVDLAHPEFGHLDDGTPCFVLDGCIADAVQALWVAGVRTLGCCCGHGSGHGVISVTVISGQYAMSWSVLGEHGETRHGLTWITVPCPHTCTGQRIVSVDNQIGPCSERLCL